MRINVFFRFFFTSWLHRSNNISKIRDLKQSVDLEEAREVIHSHHVIQVVKVKKVCANFRLRAIWNVMTDARLLLLPCTVVRTIFTLGSEIFYATLHIEPIDQFSSAP